MRTKTEKASMMMMCPKWGKGQAPEMVRVYRSRHCEVRAVTIRAGVLLINLTERGVLWIQEIKEDFLEKI
jgi:hypothetical protein